MRYDTMNDTINHFIATAPWNPIHCRDLVTQVLYVYKNSLQLQSAYKPL